MAPIFQMKNVKEKSDFPWVTSLAFRAISHSTDVDGV